MNGQTDVLEWNPRLRRIADWVRRDVLLVDVGSDHAYLPSALLLEGKIRTAIAADIAPQALAQARSTAQNHGLAENQLRFFLGDGLQGLALPELADIALCGMGGALMARIIGECAALQNSQIHLLLQPMTEAALLRRFLAANGFAVRREDVVQEGKRFYPCLLAAYDGKVYELDLAQAELGDLSVQQGGAVFADYVRHRRAIVQSWHQKKRAAGQNADQEAALLNAFSAAATAWAEQDKTS